MKKEKLLKTMIVLIIGIILFAMTNNVFAADVDFFEDTTNQLNTTNTSTGTNTNTNTNSNTTNTNNTTNVVDTSATSNVNTNTNTNNYNTNLPKAGIRENTMLGVVITVLALLAVYAYKKINQYKNI